jgi:Xaa-Pro aminopeptidase
VSRPSSRSITSELERQAERDGLASLSGIPWPRDEPKLEHVRALMAERGLDALVVRAPDNVLYLTNFWGMKGYDAVVFPREGEPTLITLTASEEDAARTAWTSDVRLFSGYDEVDPRPPVLRALDQVRSAALEFESVGLELSLGTQAADRMVGEPTTFPKAWFDAFPGAQDATPLLNEARSLKTEQELARMRLANEIAAAAMEHVRETVRPGQTEAQAAATWLAFVHGEGTGWKGQVELALGFSLVWSGTGIRTFTATTSRPVAEGEPTLFEIWVCADGYWCDHTKNVSWGDLTPAYRDLEERLSAVYDDAVAFCRPGADLAELDRRVRAGIEEIESPVPVSHPICHGVGARAHEPPYAHRAAPGEIRAGMVLAIEPAVYWSGGGGLRLEDNFFVTAAGAEKLSPFPDGIVRAL